MEEKELVCIGCPMGCRIAVAMEHGEVLEINGNTCKRGADYAKKEMTHPERTVTSTVRVEGGELSVVSVRTKTDIPKEKIFDCMKELKKVCVQAPVLIGDVVLADVCHTGVDVVATKNIEACSA